MPFFTTYPHWEQSYKKKDAANFFKVLQQPLFPDAA